MKRYCSIMLAFLLILIFPFVARADTAWEEKDGKLYFYDSEKSDPRYIRQFGYWYYILSDGEVFTGKKQGREYNDGSNPNIPYGALIEANPILMIDKVVDETNYYEIKRKEASYDKIVILLHDLGNSKDDIKKYGSELADRGCLALVPDLYAHGESSASASVPEIIEKTSETIDKLIERYDPDGKKEIDIIGNSFGGMIGLYNISKSENHISYITMINSTPDFKSLTHESFFYIYQEGIGCEPANIEEVTKALSDMSPNNDISKLTGTKMYFLNFKDSSVVPYDNVYKFIKQYFNKLDISAASKEKSDNEIMDNEFMLCISEILNYNLD